MRAHVGASVAADERGRRVSASLKTFLWFSSGCVAPPTSSQLRHDRVFVICTRVFIRVYDCTCVRARKLANTYTRIRRSGTNLLTPSRRAPNSSLRPSVSPGITSEVRKSRASRFARRTINNRGTSNKLKHLLISRASARPR